MQIRHNLVVGEKPFFRRGGCVLKRAYHLEKDENIRLFWMRRVGGRSRPGGGLGGHGALGGGWGGPGAPPPAGPPPLWGPRRPPGRFPIHTPSTPRVAIG